MMESKLKLIVVTALSALTVERVMLILGGTLPSDFADFVLLRGTSVPKISTENETRIYQVSEGADVFENVCIVEFQEEDGHPGAFYSYSRDGGSLRSAFPLDDGEAGWARFSVETVGRPLHEWETHSRGGLVTEETLFFMNLWMNPAHCLTDVAFSLAVDLKSRQNESTTMPFYSQFFHMGFWGFFDVCPTSNDPNEEQWWCCNFMKQTGLINIDNGLVRRPQQQQRGDPMCFRKLIVPRISGYRYPKGQLARSSVRQLQKMALKGTPGLVSDEWSDDELTRKRDLPILLYDRKNVERRVLVNSDELKEKLEERYHVKIDHWGAQYSRLNYDQQAALFNKFPRIIAPHGAHLANLIFTRPGARTMEIACPDDGTLVAPQEPPLNVNLTSRDQARDKRQWYGDARFLGSEWFGSFARGLFVEHFIYEEFEGCKEDGTFRIDYSPENVTLDVEAFLPFVASRFGLKKRRKSTAAAQGQPW